VHVIVRKGNQARAFESDSLLIDMSMKEIVVIEVDAFQYPDTQALGGGERYGSIF